MFEQNEEISYNPFEQEEQYDNSNEQQVENDHSEEFNNQKTNEELIGIKSIQKMYLLFIFLYSLVENS